MVEITANKQLAWGELVAPDLAAVDLDVDAAFVPDPLASYNEPLLLRSFTERRVSLKQTAHTAAAVSEENVILRDAKLAIILEKLYTKLDMILTKVRSVETRLDIDRRFEPLGVRVY